MTNKKDVLEVNRWRYAQLKHFVESLPQPIRSEDSLLPLEWLCSATDGRRGISRIYKILNGLKILGPPPFIKKWEEEMGTGDMEVDVCKILRLTHATSSDCSSTEINYKCLARWYITPDKLHQYQRDASNLCWRGCVEIGTMSHIWWTCPKIKVYWKEVILIIEEITGTKIPEEPWFCLFHGVRMSIKQYKRTLLPHLLNTAKV